MAQACSAEKKPWKILAWILIGVLAPGSGNVLSAQAVPRPLAKQEIAQIVTSQTVPQSLIIPADPAASVYKLPFEVPPRVRRCRLCLRRKAVQHSSGFSRPVDARPVGATRLAPPGREQEWQPQASVVDASSLGEMLRVQVGRSVVLTSAAPLRRIYVGNSKVVHSFSSGPREDIVTALSCGTSTLILWDQAGHRLMYTVFADLDTDGLERAISEALPDANVSVHSKTDRVFLSGTVNSDAAADLLGRLAANYSKTVVNGVRVLQVHNRQVELKVRIVEVDRSRLAQYGVNFFALGGSTTASTSTQQFGTTVTAPTSSSGLTVSDPLNLLLYSAKLNAGVTIKDLEQKQVLQVLAEPTLTTLSGVTAHFLSGGEFPLPVVQGGTGNSTAITIVWKPYGVKVEFTPTVNADDTIRLKVAPEVSALDYTNAVTISGFTIPALSTRKAETEVELRNGQSFVISGLLDHRTTESLSHMPGIANIPVLGQLFRSKGVNLSTVDLFVLVTATLVDPLTHAQAYVEPKMVVPNLADKSFDRDVTPKSTRTPKAAGDDPTSEGEAPLPRKEQP